MPRKVIGRWLVLLTSPCRPACPVPGRLAAWWTWSPDRWASQANQAGGSHPGSRTIGGEELADGALVPD